jgi:hypothetical protein
VRKKNYFSVTCVFCLGGESNWTVTGIRDLKHLFERVKNMKPLQPIFKML